MQRCELIKVAQPNTTLHNCILYHSPGIVPGSANQRILEHVNLRSDVSKEWLQLHSPLLTWQKVSVRIQKPCQNYTCHSTSKSELDWCSGVLNRSQACPDYSALCSILACGRVPRVAPLNPREHRLPKTKQALLQLLRLKASSYHLVFGVCSAPSAQRSSVPL